MKFKAIFLLSLVIIGHIYSNTKAGGKGSKGKGPKKKTFDKSEKESLGKFSF